MKRGSTSIEAKKRWTMMPPESLNLDKFKLRAEVAASYP